MIFSFDSKEGVDLFTRNNQGYLIYEWSRISTPSFFDYKVISDTTACNPCFASHENIIHIYFINQNRCLVHKKINKLYPEDNYLYNISDSMECSFSPAAFIRDHQINIFYVNTQKELIWTKHGLQKYDLIQNKIIDKNLSVNSHLLLIDKAKKEPLLVYVSEGVLKYFKIGQFGTQIETHLIGLGISIGKEWKYDIIEVNNSFHLFFVNHQNKLCCCHLNRNLTKLQPIDIVNQRTKGIHHICCFVNNNNKIFVIDHCSSKQIQVFTYDNSKWCSKIFPVAEAINGQICCSKIYQECFLAFFDDSQITVKYKFISKENDFSIQKVPQRPYLLWQNIKEQLEPIGQEGYYADCFLMRDNNLVVKKYRTVHHAIRVKRELEILTQLEKIEPHSFDHYLIDKGVLMGFTLPFYRGKMWDQYLVNPNSIFRRSPVARIKLVLKLWKSVKSIQEICLCHGDIHFENILIDLDEEEVDLLNPNFQIKLIDFGNAFMMTSQKPVTQGLTGWGPLVPPEAQFSYKTNYNPFGINAYQFARNSLFILLLKPFSAIETTDYTPLRELGQLKKHNEYPSQLYNIMRQLVHYDIQRRNKVLLSDCSFLQQKSRYLFMNSLQREEKF